MQRQVYHSLLTKDGWAVKCDGKVMSKHKTQAESERAAVRKGRLVQKRGGRGQAVFHKSNGTIRQERTYGADPRKSSG